MGQYLVMPFRGAVWAEHFLEAMLREVYLLDLTWHLAAYLSQPTYFVKSVVPFALNLWELNFYQQVVVVLASSEIHG